MENFLESQVEMWLDNYLDDVEYEDYTAEQIEEIRNKYKWSIVNAVNNNESLWDLLDGAIRYQIDLKLNELKCKKGDE